MIFNRRALLKAAPRAALALASGGWAMTQGMSAHANPLAPVGSALRNGVFNPCLEAMPAAVRDQPWVRSAFEGVQHDLIWDAHAHLLGTGDSGPGTWLSPKLKSFAHPVEFMRRKGILNAACVDESKGAVDEQYVRRVVEQINAFPAGAKMVLFAFEYAHTDEGVPAPDQSTFFVGNEYAARIASRYADRLEWVASIHPYRPDALDALRLALARGARGVKWLPSAMNIDLRDARCKGFYEALVRADVPLIVHSGEEHAVPGAGRNDLGNPLHVRVPLALGVKVVMAHCGSLGKAADLDRQSQAPAHAFDLFSRLMDETDGRQRLLGDISAVFQVNREKAVWLRFAERPDWQDRLLNGSDYPLPGIWPLYDMHRLVRAGLLPGAAIEPLTAVRKYNSLLFDFVLKRSMRRPHVGDPLFASAVFESRTHFMSGASLALHP